MCVTEVKCRMIVPALVLPDLKANFECLPRLRFFSFRSTLLLLRTHGLSHLRIDSAQHLLRQASDMLRFRATSALPLRSTVATLSGSCCSNSTVTHSTLLASSASSVPSCRSLHTTAHTRTTAAIPHRGTWLQHSSVATSSVRGFSTAAAAATATAASTAEEDADTSSIAAAVGRRPPGTTLPAACLLTEAEQRHAIAFGPTRNIRNFSIIAHIDHGKSTLADRLLESAGNIRPLAKQDAQVLDNLQVERERGITVKAVTATMFYRCPITKEEYVLNLIDTPGHVDFSYEVSRSLAACEGALLLVDASQGIQAQTLANFYTALEADLDIIPVISKVDLPHADVAGVKEQITTAFGMDADSALLISSKTGIGIDAVFDAIVKRIKPPQSPAVAAAEKAAATTAATAASAYSSSSSSSSSSSTALTRPFPSAVLDPLSIPLRAFVFDSWYSSHRGVICLVKVVDGAVRRNDRIAPWHGDASTAATTTTATGATATATNASSLSPSSSSPSAGGGGAIYDVQELGLLLGTSMREVEVLRAGQVGYLIGGIKTTGEVRLGETFFKVGVRKGAKHAQNVDTFVSAAAAATGANNKGATAASASSSSSPSSSSASSPPHRSLSPDALASAHVAPSRAAIEPLPGFKPARSVSYTHTHPHTRTHACGSRDRRCSCSSREQMYALLRQTLHADIFPSFLASAVIHMSLFLFVTHRWCLPAFSLAVTAILPHWRVLCSGCCSPTQVCASKKKTPSLSASASAAVS